MCECVCEFGVAVCILGSVRHVACGKRALRLLYRRYVGELCFSCSFRLILTARPPSSPYCHAPMNIRKCQTTSRFSGHCEDDGDDDDGQPMEAPHGGRQQRVDRRCLPSLTWPQNIGTNIKRAWAAKCQLWRSKAVARGGGRRPVVGPGYSLNYLKQYP